MRKQFSLFLALCFSVLAFGFTGCDTAAVNSVGPENAVTADARPDNLIQAVRAATSRFNSTTQARRAGYEPGGHCVDDEDLGGMGYHWVNGALIDPIFDPLMPEALLYEPGNGNNPRLVGVEYIVIDVGQAHPHFGAHPFDVGGVPPLEEEGIDHYSLHVWIHKDNPNGMFAPFNPNVSCD